MGEQHQPEKRDYIRIQARLPVRYRFLKSGTGGMQALGTASGETTNLSGGGLCLVGPIPDLDWVVELLMEKIAVWVEIEFPGAWKPVRAVTRVAWLEGLNEGTRVCSMGLRFKEITREAQDRILDYIIESQLPP
ncbi:MAG: PilZ domain-containing protein [Planctomycetes bacterium]|nr:PilZ domain-containing protein [Planctomycetota bacterium]